MSAITLTLGRNHKKPTYFDKKCREWSVFYSEALKTQATRDTYMRSHNMFFEWLNKNKISINNHKKLSKTPKKKLQTILEDYLIYKKRSVKPSALRIYMSAIKAFLDFWDVEYSKKRLDKMMPKANKPAGSVPYSLQQVQQLFDATRELRNKAMIATFYSSGIRRGAITELCYKDLKPMEDCYEISTYANDPEDENAEYTTFCSPEARILIDLHTEKKRTKFGNIITPDSPVFSYHRDPNKKLTHRGLTTIFNEIIKNSKIIREKREGYKDYETAIIHGLRHGFKE